MNLPINSLKTIELELILDAFQGSHACVRIAKGKGVLTQKIDGI